jgi:hypothetical protein
MDENMLRFLMMAAFISGALCIAAVSNELSYYSISDPFESYYPVIEVSNVTELLRIMPLEEHVSLSGTVSHIGDDHVSDNGNEYQQFFITDGSSEVKVFCSKGGSPVSIEEGDEVFVAGKFQKYYQTIEIYAECSSINVLNP